MTAEIIRGLPFADYLAIERDSNSSLADLRVSPKLYLHRRTHERPDTAALKLGRAFHSCVLTPDLSALDFVVYRESKSVGAGSRTRWKEFQEAMAAEGKTILDAAEYDACLAMRAAVYADPLALRRLAQAAEHEVTILWEHHGLPLKSRTDGLGSIILDLKKTRRDSVRLFELDATRLGYHVQAALYQDAVKQATGERLPYVIVAVQDQPPWDVVVYPVGDEELEIGRQRYEMSISQLQVCQASNSYPGISGGHEHPLRLAQWVYEADVDDLICDDKPGGDQ